MFSKSFSPVSVPLSLLMTGSIESYFLSLSTTSHSAIIPAVLWHIIDSALV